MILILNMNICETDGIGAPFTQSQTERLKNKSIESQILNNSLPQELRKKLLKKVYSNEKIAKIFTIGIFCWLPS